MLMLSREEVPTAGGDEWNERELEIAVGAYFALLGAELVGAPLVKREVVSRAATELPARTRGSIEYRFANISFVLQTLDLPWVTGYVPHSHIRADLVGVIEGALQFVQIYS